MDTSSFTVLGMTCGHCKASIEAALGGMAGVEAVAVNLESKRVDVSFDPQQQQLGSIQRAVEEQGFEVEELDGG